MQLAPIESGDMDTLAPWEGKMFPAIWHVQRALVRILQLWFDATEGSTQGGTATPQILGREEPPHGNMENHRTNVNKPWTSLAVAGFSHQQSRMMMEVIPLVGESLVTLKSLFFRALHDLLFGSPMIFKLTWIGLIFIHHEILPCLILFDKNCKWS